MLRAMRFGLAACVLACGGQAFGQNPCFCPWFVLEDFGSFYRFYGETGCDSPSEDVADLPTNTFYPGYCDGSTPVDCVCAATAKPVPTIGRLSRVQSPAYQPLLLPANANAADQGRRLVALRKIADASLPPGERECDFRFGVFHEPGDADRQRPPVYVKLYVVDVAAHRVHLSPKVVRDVAPKTFAFGVEVTQPPQPMHGPAGGRPAAALPILQASHVAATTTPGVFLVRFAGVEGVFRCNTTR